MTELDRGVSSRFEILNATFDERSSRLWAAAEAQSAGRGGISAVNRATGISRTTIAQGIRELADPTPAEERTRSPGGGRKRIADSSPGLREELDALLDPATRGDPESALRWTCSWARTSRGATL